MAEANEPGLHRSYTVDGGLTEDQHGIVRRPEVERETPGGEKRTRTTSPESQGRNGPVLEERSDDDEGKR